VGAAAAAAAAAEVGQGGNTKGKRFALKNKNWKTWKKGGRVGASKPKVGFKAKQAKPRSSKVAEVQKIGPFDSVRVTDPLTHICGMWPFSHRRGRIIVIRRQLQQQCIDKVIPDCGFHVCCVYILEYPRGGWRKVLSLRVEQL